MCFMVKRFISLALPIRYCLSDVNAHKMWKFNECNSNAMVIVDLFRA